MFLYEITDKGCEIILLDVLERTRGYGRALMDAVKEEVLKQGIRRLFLITTNNNTGAIEFYKKLGYKIVNVRENAMEEARGLKPSIPEICDESGLPVKDEIEMELIF